MTDTFTTNPWFSIWTQPRQTIRAIVARHPRYHFFYLAALYGLQNVLFYATYYSVGLTFHFAIVLLLAVVLSPLIGIVWFYFYGWLLHFTGRWLKGEAPFSHVQAALAWSKVPLVINILMWFILLAFTSEGMFIQYVSAPSIFFINAITLITGIWSLVILIQGIREVQNFSVWRTIGNLVIAYVIFAVFIFALSFLYGLYLRYAGV